MQIFVGELKVPPVEAVAAPIGNELADFPGIVLARGSDEVRRSAAVDADDFSEGRAHGVDYCLTDCMHARGSRRIAGSAHRGPS